MTNVYELRAGRGFEKPLGGFSNAGGKARSGRPAMLGRRPGDAVLARAPNGELVTNS